MVPGKKLSDSNEVAQSSDSSESYDTDSDSILSDVRLNQEAYVQVDPTLPIIPAFFYRKDELNKLVDKKLEEIVQKQDKYLESLKKRAETFFITYKNPTVEERNKFILQEKEITKNLPIKTVIGNFIGQTLKKIQDSLTIEPISKAKIFEFIDEILQEDSKDEEEGLDNRNTTEATILAYEEYFQEKYKTLTTNGMVYTLPEGKHKWSYNASWLRGHFNKGTEAFIIKSKIDEESKFRGESSESSGDLGSGFFREIAVCAKFGYKLQRDNQNNIILKHDNSSVLQKKTLEEIMSISVDVMIPYYNDIMKEYNQLTSQPNRFVACTTEWPSSFAAPTDEQTQLLTSSHNTPVDKPELQAGKKRARSSSLTRGSSSSE